MRKMMLLKRVGWVLCLLLMTTALAAEPQDPLVGDWLLKSEFDGRPMNSMFLLSKDAGGAYAGQWVSFFGMRLVDNLKVEGEKISFSQTFRFGDQDMTSNFSGTIKDGKMQATMSNDNGDISFEGSKLDMPAIFGVWEFRRQREGQEIVSKLAVGRDKDGKITADWQSGANQQGTWEISDVNYDSGKLTFKRKNTNPDRPMEMTYSLTAQGDAINGTAVSQRGERQVEGKRLNGELVGKWELTMTSDRGERKQLLYVMPDMTALFGGVDVGKIDCKDGSISFKYQMNFGDRAFSNEFKGKIQDGKLTGEMTNSRGTQQVSGQKMQGSK
ncbi:MAG: hypothetical protein LLF76_07195 [Planctomycetaceae bacterium]|nr:hypothetical protein [Planctomycetaceae bacterium]